MPFEFGAVNKERTVHTEIEFEDMEGALPLDYYPGRVGDALDKLKAMGDTDDPEAALKQIFLSVVAKWDVTSNGQPVPLSVEGLDAIGLPSWRITQILSAIISEVHVGEAKGTRLRRR